MQRAFLSPPPSPLDRGHPGGPGGGRGEKNCPPLILPSSCFIDEHVTRVAWLNRSNILYAGNDRWTSDPRVRLLTNTPEEFSILITQVGLGDEGLYTCSFQTRHQPYTTQVYLIVHGEPSAGALAGEGGAGDGRWGLPATTKSPPTRRGPPRGTPRVPASGGLRPLVELCVEPAGLCGRCRGVAVPLRVVPSPTGLWFGAFPGAFGLGRAQPQRRGTSP